MEYKLTIADKTHNQPIPSKTWTALKFTDATQNIFDQAKFRLWDGRTHITCWVSSNWPTDPVKQQLIDAINATQNGTAAWFSAIEAAVKYILKDEPPTWKFRVIRNIPDSVDDPTGRDVSYVAEVTDWAEVYEYELDTDLDETYSIEVWHNAPNTVILDTRIVHFVRILYDVR